MDLGLAAAVDRSVVAGGKGAGPGIEAGVNAGVVAVIVDVRSVAAYPDSTHSLLEARSHLVADGQVMVLA